MYIITFDEASKLRISFIGFQYQKIFETGANDIGYLQRAVQLTETRKQACSVRAGNNASSDTVPLYHARDQHRHRFNTG
jgi:hypothetical protein